MIDRDTDRHAWATEQAALLRELQPPGVDWEGIADELHDIAALELIGIQEGFIVLRTHHLLRDRDGRSETAAIREARRRTTDDLDDSPSLMARVDGIITDAYAIARDRASAEADAPVSEFPEACQYIWADLRG